MTTIELHVAEPFWPVPQVPGGSVLHWSDPRGNGDLYETAAGQWFWWNGAAHAMSKDQAMAWLKLARRRQRRRC